MNRLPCWLLGLGLSLLLASVATARDKEKRPEPPMPPLPPLPFLQPVYSPLNPGILEKLKLTDEQKEKVEKLRKDLEGKQKEMVAKLQGLMEKARQGKDPEAGRKMGEEFRASQLSVQKQYAEAEKKLREVLTEEQKKTYQEVKSKLPPFPGTPPPFPPPMGFRPYPGQILPPPMQEMLRLSPEQKAKIAKLQKEAEEKIVEVLNEEQKKKLDEFKKRFEGPPPPPNPGPPRE